MRRNTISGLEMGQKSSNQTCLRWKRCIFGKSTVHTDFLCGWKVHKTLDYSFPCLKIPFIYKIPCNICSLIQRDEKKEEFLAFSLLLLVKTILKASCLPFLEGHGETLRHGETMHHHGLSSTGYTIKYSLFAINSQTHTFITYTFVSFLFIFTEYECNCFHLNNLV